MFHCITKMPCGDDNVGVMFAIVEAVGVSKLYETYSLCSKNHLYSYIPCDTSVWFCFHFRLMNDQYQPSCIVLLFFSFTYLRILCHGTVSSCTNHIMRLHHMLYSCIFLTFLRSKSCSMDCKRFIRNVVFLSSLSLTLPQHV